ncbi:MAG: triose-phosphate isomerase, partial [Deltaproteobacteria bacterium]
MRTPMIAGNWKMHKGPSEARTFALDLAGSLGRVRDVEVVVAPPFVSLVPVREAIEGSPIKLCAQDVFWENEGAFTGEISPLMLKDCGCTYVIIGHSERRTYFGETDETVNRKIRAALKAGLKAIVCVGERLEER